MVAPPVSESDISRSLFPANVSDICMRLIWEHEHVLKADEIYRTCWSPTNRRVNSLDQVVYRKYVECMLWEVKKARKFSSEQELLLRSINASRIGLTFQDEEHRRHHYNMVANLGTQLSPYISQHCNSAGQKSSCRDCFPFDPVNPQPYCDSGRMPRVKIFLYCQHCEDVGHCVIRDDYAWFCIKATNETKRVYGKPKAYDRLGC